MRFPLFIALFSFNSALEAAPFQIHSAAEMRADYAADWSEFSTTSGTPVPDEQSFIVTGNGDVTVFGSGLTIESSGAQIAAPDRIDIEPPALAQGFGVVASGGILTLSIWDSAPAEIARFTVSASSPVFVGIVDPEARIALVSIESASPGGLAIGDPVFQNAPSPDYGSAPIAGEFTFRLNASKTYLHEGLERRGSTPPTTTATQDFANSCDLSAEFPTLLPGDILRFERKGVARDNEGLNPVLGVFSSSETITRGTEFDRLPDAIEAGADLTTETVVAAESSIDIATPTNISEDFQVGFSTLIVVPQGAQFAFFTLARPGDESFPPRVRISHIQRDAFLDWAATFGIVGTLADETGDLDGDGLTLVEEYAYGTDPTVGENTAPVSLGATAGPLSLTYSARTDTPLSYTAEFSSDLTSWLPALSTSLTNEGGVSRFIAEDPESGARRFGRLTIETTSRPSL